MSYIKDWKKPKRDKAGKRILEYMDNHGNVTDLFSYCPKCGIKLGSKSVEIECIEETRE